MNVRGTGGRQRKRVQEKGVRAREAEWKVRQKALDVLGGVGEA